MGFSNFFIFLRRLSMLKKSLLVLGLSAIVMCGGCSSWANGLYKVATYAETVISGWGGLIDMGVLTVPFTPVI
jgi:hypothetical protein